MGVISSGVLARLAKVGLVVVAVSGLSAGASFACQAGPGGGGDGTELPTGATVAASATAPLATLTPTTEPPTPEPTPSPSATALPTLPPAPTATAEESKWPALPPPPAKPESPTVIQAATVGGGQWYEFAECFVFYLPPGYDFATHVAINDPGGDLTIAFEVNGLDSAVVFSESTGTEVGRTVTDPALQPVFDQIASTFDKAC